jgi:hypothetical protein
MGNCVESIKLLLEKRRALGFFRFPKKRKSNLTMPGGVPGSCEEQGMF